MQYIRENDSLGRKKAKIVTKGSNNVRFVDKRNADTNKSLLVPLMQAYNQTGKTKTHILLLKIRTSFFPKDQFEEV